MDDFERLDEVDLQVDAIERSLSDARDLSQAFATELSGMRSTLSETSAELTGLSRGVTRGLKTAFEELIFDGGRLSDVMRDLAASVTRSAYQAAVKPVFSHFGGLVSEGIENLIGGILPFEKGASFSQGRVMPFANGGIVSGPVRFPMRGGTGLMGEAGPEAIMPLTRGPDGRLGVHAQGGGRPVNVVFNVTTPDVAGFERSRSQIAAQMARALGQGQRNR